MHCSCRHSNHCKASVRLRLDGHACWGSGSIRPAPGFPRSTLERQCFDRACCASQDRLEKKSFFNWFYFAINWGSCLAVTVVVYVQDSISWAIGFAIPTVAMAVAITTFTAGSSLYTHVEPTERCLMSSGLLHSSL